MTTPRKTRVVNKLPQKILTVQQRAAKAVLQAVILGAGEAAAVTPRETSTLINSQFRRVEQRGTRIVGTVGYTAEYALAVHEAKGTLQGQGIPRASGKGVYWGPSGEPGFLRIGFERAKPSIDSVVKKTLKG